jgi:predicted lipid-binding transport protein (Tim44 family)
VGWALAAAAVLGRAGGGQNFGGGGGGGGGTHVSSGGGGGLFLLPFFLGGGGLLTLLIIGAVIFMISRAASSSMGSGGGGEPMSPPPVMGPGAAPAMPAPASAGPYDDSHPVGVPDRFRGETLEGTDAGAMGAGDQNRGIAAIKAHDPDFDETAFVSQVERAFFVVEQAWSELKPEMSRRVMADALWQQHNVQIEQYQAEGRRNVLDNLSVGRADITGAHTDQTYDTITVRILAACADYDVDVKSGKIVRGSRDVGQWSEDWIFQRSSAATTKPGGGTMSQKCPNCGAPLDLDLAGVCSYCKAPVMSGKYDWVLTRIDQVSSGY